MTDQELIARLRDGCNLQQHDGELAADRIDELVKERDEQKTYTDAAYLERNKLVALFASIYPSGIKRTVIEGWSEDWHGCVYINFPWGQGSWHYHDSQGYLFSYLPAYSGEWDGHSTEDKYAAIVEASRKDNNATAKLAKAIEALRGWDTAYKTGRNEPLQIAAETTRTVLAELEGKEMTDQEQEPWPEKVYLLHPSIKTFGYMVSSPERRMYVLADRIEELMKENERLEDQCEGLFQAGMNNGQALIIENAKLAKAVGALTIAKQFLGHTWVEQHVNAVLAELEGKE